MTPILPATPKNIAHAARILQQGGLVAFPTETVYGLGANALNADALARIFTAKERPTQDPLIVHLTDKEELPRIVSAVSPAAQTLAEAFWPGPLTLILPRLPHLPALLSAGLPTVAVRVPNHPVAQALLQQAGVPIAAPSANRFGHTSPTTAAHVWQDLNGRVDLILDGGETQVGLESTVVDVSTSPARILRPGGVTREMLESVLGQVTALGQKRNPEAGLPSPGLLEKHYAPRAEMVLFGGENAQETLFAALTEARAQGRRVGWLAAQEDLPGWEDAAAALYPLGADLPSVAHQIYAGMRWLDEQGVDVIFCRDVEAVGLGLAIADRLRRAATRRVGC